MPGIVIALIVIFAVVAIVFLALAAYHFAAAKKESPAEPEPEPGNTYSDAGSSGRSGYGCNTHPDTDCHTFHNAER